jgi:putative N6-adenine-specific DNA methylase
MHLNLCATTAFGLEAAVKREAASLGFSGINALDGRVNFTGDLDSIAKANLCLRSADRVLLIMGSFTATTFNDLFEQTKALNWSDWIPADGNFTISGKSVRSTLHSVPACQSIVEKAIVESLKTRHKVERFKKTGPEFKVQVSLLKDLATLSIDTSGAGLHKRGYRQQAMEAPLKETLASALISLTYWKPGRTLLDPVCGSGTIPIEAAMIAKNIAPGLRRSFACEDWPIMGKKIFRKAREEAEAKIAPINEVSIFGSDIDPAAIELAKSNSIKAGVSGITSFEVKPMRDVTLPGHYGVAVLNPPYAMRLGTANAAEALIKDMAMLLRQDPTWSLNVLTADEFFEKVFGKKADSKRKLFNAMIKTDYYQYHGPKPPKLS